MPFSTPANIIMVRENKSVALQPLACFELRASFSDHFSCLTEEIS